MKLELLLFLFSLLSVGLHPQFVEAANTQDKGVIGQDGRIASDDPKIGRLHFNSGEGGCTATMIGKSCAITAGHCIDSSFSIQFNVPLPGKIFTFPAKARDTYLVDRSSIVRQNNAHDDEDWMVFQIKKHKPISKFRRWFASNVEKNSNIEKYPKEEEYYPGSIQGFYQISTGPNSTGDAIQITGYGTDPNKKLDQTQRKAEGTLIKKRSIFSPFALFHNVDTTPGDSGAPVINIATGKIIGVHNAFFCNALTKTNCYNTGTSINLSKRFQDAINDCLKRDN